MKFGPDTPLLPRPERGSRDALPRRWLHWDEYGVVLYGGAPAARGESVIDCLSGLRSMVFPWAELERVRLVEPYPAVELVYQFEGVLQRETVIPSASEAVDPFADHVAMFCDAVRRRCGDGAVSDGWQGIVAVPWEPVSRMPNDPQPTPIGIYRAAPYRSPIVAVRWPAGVTEQWRVLLFRGETFCSGTQASYERVLARQRTPWSVQGREVLLTHDHVYARTRKGVLRIGLEMLRRRVDLPQLRLYLFGLRSVLVLADRTRCPLQAALDRLLTPRLLYR